MSKYTIQIYTDAKGNCPVDTFLNGLPPKLLAKTLRNIRLLGEFGPQLREPYSKALTNGIFELRMIHGTDISRVLYFFFANGKIVLTNGFIKKSQKTPSREIILAEKYRTDWLQRNNL